jgi:hypothetical protein
MKTKKTQTNESGSTAEEREETLQQMTAISAKFYDLVFHANMGSKAHAFVEFTGLMNEYIQICREAEKQGIDFGHANTHSGKALPMQDHQAQYLAEKLNCIYGPALLLNPSVRDAFIATLFGGEYRLVANPKTRSPGYEKLSGADQWAEDRANGTLDDPYAR